MGKTKLLYEFKKCFQRKYAEAAAATTGEARSPSWNPFVKLILCREAKQPQEREVFDHFLKLPKSVKEEREFTDRYNAVTGQLDELVRPAANSGDQIVLLFDEAHYLTDPADGEKSGYIFRLVLLWLRNKHVKVVAVFAGTTSKLNFKFSEDFQQIQTDTRNAAKLHPGQFHKRGEKFFDTFYTTTTVGCLRGKSCSDAGSEYDRSIFYGRPLFAAMQLKNELTPTNTENILQRMLLQGGSHVQGTAWSKNNTCCLNILASRIQMGQTSVQIASDLVGRAYANLVDVDGDRMRISYPPDPVCARLAMCLMDENWSITLKDERTIKGMSKENWVKKVADLFSERIFTVEKGDFSEVLVAFYFLLCADEIRGEYSDKSYLTFSVPLEDWITSLNKVEERDDAKTNEGCHDEEMANDDDPMDVEEQKSSGNDNKRPRTRTTRNSEAASSDRGTGEGQEPEQTKIFFNAIQICRNHLRGYASDWTSLCNQEFLRNIFNAGVGFYVFAGCATIDCVFSMVAKNDKDDVVGYIPMFVSVKSHDDFTEGAASLECHQLQKKARAANPAYGALCLLVAFGGERKGGDKENLLDSSCMRQLWRRECAARVLRISRHDRFGLADVFASMTSVRDEMTEILTSHCFVSYDDAKLELTQTTAAMTKKKKPEDYAIQSLRKTRRRHQTSDNPLITLSELASQLQVESHENESSPGT